MKKTIKSDLDIYMYFQMVKEREDELGNMDNQRRIERVQDKFPHDDLQLRDFELQVNLHTYLLIQIFCSFVILQTFNWFASYVLVKCSAMCIRIS